MNHLKSITLSGMFLAAAICAPLVLAQETSELPPIAEYVLPSELASADKAGFLEGVTAEVSKNPSQAGEIVQAALKLRFEDIQRTPSLAGEIVMAAIQGLPPDFRTVNIIAEILNAAVEVLKALPADQTQIPGEVVQMVLASLPPDLAEAVKVKILQGPEGALRNQITFIFTAIGQAGFTEPPGRSGERGRSEEKREENQPPDRPPVTPTVPQGPPAA